MSDTKSRFDAAVATAKTLPPQSTTTQLELYGLFKQASSGDVSGARPGMFDLRGRAKWDAWHKRMGMTAEAAMEAYIAYVAKVS